MPRCSLSGTAICKHCDPGRVARGLSAHQPTEQCCGQQPAGKDMEDADIAEEGAMNLKEGYIVKQVTQMKDRGRC